MGACTTGAVAASAEDAKLAEWVTAAGEGFDVVARQVLGGAADAAPGLFANRHLCSSLMLVAVAAPLVKPTKG